MNKIASDQHVLRYIPPSKIDRNNVSAFAFVREARSSFIPVWWKEHAQGSSDKERVKEIRLAGRLSADSRLAELNVGETIKHVQTAMLLQLGFQHHPLADDQCHSRIDGLPDPDKAEALTVGQLIAMRITHVY
jgi:hypothetical protein